MENKKKTKCKYCKGTGMVQIGPNIKGLKPCPYCNKQENSR